MGLTIHYTLRLRHTVSSAHAFALVQTAHRRATQLTRHRKLRGLTAIVPAAEESWAVEHRRVGPKRQDQWAELAPVAGWVFIVHVGRDCEPAMFGLCRYPATAHTRYGTARTGCGSGWLLKSFSKTQYASVHGWEHFLKCHRAVIDLALLWEKLGVEVTLSDEGDYWPGRNVRALRRELDEMNGVVAGLAGALKDAADGAARSSVQSPIFAHPQFERLEAEGVTQHAGKIGKVVAALRR
ncbi:MAG TPA: hypothetical protein VHD62_04885 [Opitutaceae bacterium]|nr:hypothetical protein [Opitutaceae bacterium]